MKSDFEVDVQKKNDPDIADIPLPSNCIAVGKIAADDVQVYIKQDVYKQIEKYSRSDTSNELGSILFGEYTEKSGQTYVVISQFIKAEYTENTASTLTFTHETWNDIHEKQQERCPQLKMIGWQHTHPNYGIFLSNYDLFIQENFFDMPFQVAYVVDPVQNLRGFFQWKNGKTEKLNGYYVYDDEKNPIKIKQSEPKEETVPKSGKKLTLILFTTLSLALIISLISLNIRLNDQLRQIESINAALLQANSSEIEQEETSSAAENDQNVVILQAYSVKDGDSLSQICADFGLDYQANIDIIKALNGIDEVDEITAGQAIILPVLSEND